jgi:hypothetical protein
MFCSGAGRLFPLALTVIIKSRPGQLFINLDHEHLVSLPSSIVRSAPIDIGQTYGVSAELHRRACCWYEAQDMYLKHYNMCHILGRYAVGADYPANVW